MLTVAILVGSLRKESINLVLARSIERLAEGRMAFDYVDLADLPLYNEDLWANVPAAVTGMKAKVADADGVLMVTPEYNRSIPAVLKNALDWGSRPWGQSSWAGKPGAVAGASLGAIGSAVAQSHIRSSMQVLDFYMMGQPEVYLNYSQAQIDPTTHEVGNEVANALLSRFAAGLEAWIKRFN